MSSIAQTLLSNARSDAGDVRIVYSDGKNGQSGNPETYSSRKGAPATGLTETAQFVDFKQRVQDHISDLMRTSTKMNWWKRTIGRDA